MANKQAKVALRFAEQFDLHTIAFRDFVAVVFEDGDYIKAFDIGERWMEPGSITEGVVTGDLLIVPKRQLVTLEVPSKKLELPSEAFGCPLVNFLWISPYCNVVGGRFDDRLCTELTRLFAALPSDEQGWRDQFSPDFFDLDGLGRFRALVDHLSKLDPDAESR